MNHKHCRLCGDIIDTYKSSGMSDNEKFKIDISYSNGFCRKCMDEFGLDRLCKWWHREITYFELLGEE